MEEKVDIINLIQLCPVGRIKTSSNDLELLINLSSIIYNLPSEIVGKIETHTFLHLIR